MKISLVTDEISADPETAIELGVEWGIHDFELRGFGHNRVPLYSDFQKQRIRELLEEFEASVVAISPGLFKIPLPTAQRQRFPLRTFDYKLHREWRSAHDLLQYHQCELLPLSIEYAQEVGARVIVIFSFERGQMHGDPAPDLVLETLERSARLAEEAGMVLAIEVEEGFWADTGANTAAIVRAVGRDGLAVNWDPGNALSAGDRPYPDGYDAVRELVRHVHFKDLQRRPGGDEYVIEGELPWEAQIRALGRDGYQGYISVESHMAPKVQSARLLTRRLQQLISTVSDA